MPRGTNGVYDWPTNTEAKSGEVISAARYNTFRDDLKIELNKLGEDILESPSDFIQIDPPFSEKIEDAAANTTRLNAALLEAQTTGRRLVTDTGQHIPIEVVTLPAGGNFEWVSTNGTEFRPAVDNTDGYLIAADRNVTLVNVLLRGIHLRPFTNPATTNSYSGNMLYGSFTNSKLEDLTYSNYYGDQAFILALYNTLMDGTVAFTSDTTGGSGGLRLVGGNRSYITRTRIVSGDDAIQFVPIKPSTTGTPRPLENLDISDCHYSVATVNSDARAIVAICDETVTSSIRDCSFTDVTGNGGDRVCVIETRTLGSLIRNMTIDNVHLNNSSQAGTAGSPEAVYIRGNVRESNIDMTVKSPSRYALRVEESLISEQPQKNFIKMDSIGAPDVAELAVFVIDSGNNNIYTLTGTPPTDQAIPIVRVTAANSNVFDKCDFGIVTGTQRCMTFTSGLNNDIVGCRFSGASTATAYHLSAVAAPSTRVLYPHFDGPPARGVAAGILTDARTV